MKKQLSLTVVRIKGNDNIVKARIQGSDTKEFFVYAISKDDLSKIENTDEQLVVANQVVGSKH